MDAYSETPKKTNKSWLWGLVPLFVLLSVAGWSLRKVQPALLDRSEVSGGDTPAATANRTQGSNTALYNEIVREVLPEQGFQSKIRLGESVVRLVEHGVIDKKKFADLYRDRGGLPEEIKTVLEQPSDKPILITRQNANYYINLLWPLGIANYLPANKESPVNGDSLFNLASTGGWNLGKEENGGAYFNKFPIVPLTPEQEALVMRVAQSTYRPCCNNSTFYQDCNHGSALLGLLELGAAQGLTEEELYREALAFNSFWFPNNYVQIALYFKAVGGIEWKNVDPKVVLGKDYSSLSGWSENVEKEVVSRDLMPPIQGGAGCGV